MRKKHWFIGIVVLMAAVIGLGSATALAQESDGETSRLGLIARVANILGLQEQQVQDAFDQARQEMRDERFDEMVGQRLDALVESGRITQEQADELREWYAERPDSFWLAGSSARGRKGDGDQGHKFGGRGFDGGKSFGRQKDHGGHFQRGIFQFRNLSPDKEKTDPVAPTVTPAVPASTPAATPTAPADNSSSN